MEEDEEDETTTRKQETLNPSASLVGSLSFMAGTRTPISHLSHPQKPADKTMPFMASPRTSTQHHDVDAEDEEDSVFAIQDRSRKTPKKPRDAPNPGSAVRN